MTYTFDAPFLSQQVFVFMMIFARLGTMFMVLPGFGANGIPVRVRLILALAVSALMMPVVQEIFASIPGSPLGLAVVFIWEMVIGLIIGMSARIIFTALQVAGTLIAFQTALAFAQNFDPSQDSQGAVTGAFLSLTGVTLIFAADLHHLMLASMAQSYDLFAPGAEYPIAQITDHIVATVSQSFVLGVQLAVPFMVSGLIVYVAAGVIAKLIPQIQIFFVIMPANITVGFIVLMLVISSMMMLFVDRMEAHLRQFL